uniref:Uncharacterized protein n=1 Tax=Knipowitschia caucasica TaxID=637954 RepID=A0AAV2JQ21_KNICA
MSSELDSLRLRKSLHVFRVGTVLRLREARFMSSELEQLSSRREGAFMCPELNSLRLREVASCLRVGTVHNSEMSLHVSELEQAQTQSIRFYGLRVWNRSQPSEKSLHVSELEQMSDSEKSLHGLRVWEQSQTS